MPLYPILVQIRTVFIPIGVAVTSPLPLEVELPYIRVVDVEPAKALTVNLPYTTSVDVEPAQSLSVNVTYTYTITVG